ncbi:MAG: cation transporter, partial [Clostridia bacterium]|nr:cation transporter [Clostridia bacterium]
MDFAETRKTVLKVSIITIIINVFLAAIKVTAGIFGNSNAMISDAVHSVSDVVSSLLVVLSAYLTKKAVTEKDERKNVIIECVFSFILAGILLYTCFDIAYDGIERIVTGEYLEADNPAWFEIAVAVVSIIFKEGI